MDGFLSGVSGADVILQRSRLYECLSTPIPGALISFLATVSANVKWREASLAPSLARALSL